MPTIHNCGVRERAVREDRRRLKSPSESETVEGYEELMRSCTEYKATRRPLIDSVRSNLQALLERAAEVDSEKLFNVIKSDDDSKTTSQQGNNSSSSSVQIEMGTITTATTSGSLNNNDQSH